MAQRVLLVRGEARRAARPLHGTAQVACRLALLDQGPRTAGRRPLQARALALQPALELPGARNEEPCEQRPTVGVNRLGEPSRRDGAVEGDDVAR